MKKKLLHNQRGTTLLEVLFAFLVFALSALLFSQQVSAAAQLNSMAKAGQEALMEELAVAETMSREAYDIKEMVRIEKEGTSYFHQYYVQRYGLGEPGDNKLQSYKYAP